MNEKQKPNINVSDIPGVGTETTTIPNPPSVVNNKIPASLDDIAAEIIAQPLEQVTPETPGSLDPIDPPAADPVEPNIDPENNNTPENNNANLRKAKKDAETKLTAAETKIAELEAKLATPGITTEQEAAIQAKIDTAIAEKEARIAELTTAVSELEPYRDIIDIKRNPMYIEKFEKPLMALNDRLVQVATDYGLNADQLTKAMQAPNMSEREKLLVQYKVSPTGVIAIIDLVTKAMHLHAEEQTFMADKTKFKTVLDEQYRESNERTASVIKNTIQKESLLVWDGTLRHHRSDVGRNLWKTYQKNESPAWNRAVDEADRVAKSVYTEVLADIESNVLNKTVTPSLLQKIANLSMAYGHAQKNESVYQGLIDRVNAQAREIQALKDANPSFGSGTGKPPKAANSGNGSQIPPSLDEIAQEF